MFKTLASRLTALYSLLFAVMCLLAFFVISLSLRANLLQRLDNEFIGDGAEFVEVQRQGGLPLLAHEVKLETEGEGVDRVFIRIFSADGKVVLSSDMQYWPDISDHSPPPEFRKNIGFETVSLPSRGERVRIFYRPMLEGYILQAGALLSEDEALITNAQKEFALAFLVIFLGALVGGRYVARHALAGVSKVRETADQISRGNLKYSLDFQDRAEEVNELIASIKRMQARILSLIEELQEVTNNVAHDLRSPLTRIRGLVETTLSGQQSILEYREMSCAVIEECDSLVSTINTMLDIAEINAGLKPLEKETLDLAEILKDVTELYTPLAEDNQIRLDLVLQKEPLVMAGDRRSLQRAFANLLDNGLKFTQAGGQVAIEAHQQGNRLMVSLEDNGIGIPTDDLPHVFDRFYRADRSRTRPGTGLGLSLVQSIVNSHGGQLEIESTEGVGTKVTIVFDAADGHAPG